MGLKVQELKRGENPDKSRIGYYRNRGYSLFKRSLNPLASGTVDLILTGAFSRGLFVESKGNGRFLFDSNDDKTPDLISKYGTEWQGLNEDTFHKYEVDYVSLEIAKFINNQIRR